MSFKVTVGERYEAETSGNVYTVVLIKDDNSALLAEDEDKSWSLFSMDVFIHCFKPCEATEDKDPEQPYLPEYRRLEIVDNKRGFMCVCSEDHNIGLYDWIAAVNFAGFEYEDGQISAIPVRYMGERLGHKARVENLKSTSIVRPKWVLVKERQDASQ